MESAKISWNVKTDKDGSELRSNLLLLLNQAEEAGISAKDAYGANNAAAFAAYKLGEAAGTLKTFAVSALLLGLQCSQDDVSGFDVAEVYVDTVHGQNYYKFSVYSGNEYIGTVTIYLNEEGENIVLGSKVSFGPRLSGMVRNGFQQALEAEEQAMAETFTVVKNAVVKDNSAQAFDVSDVEV